MSNDTREALAAKCKTLADNLQELNLANYTDDDVRELNDWAVEAAGLIEMAAAALTEQPAAQPDSMRALVMDYAVACGELSKGLPADDPMWSELRALGDRLDTLATQPAAPDLMTVVEHVLDAGHLNTEDLGRLRAAWERAVPAAPQGVQADPTVEVWHLWHKVTVRPGKTVLRSWGPNIETEMSEAPWSLDAVQEAFDWLYAAPAQVLGDFGIWLNRLMRLADEYYRASDAARWRARVVLREHAANVGMHWRSREHLAAPAQEPPSEFSEIRAILDETYNFVSAGPRAQENINAVSELLDKLEAAWKGASNAARV